MKQRVLPAIVIFVGLIVVLIFVRQQSGTEAPIEKRIDTFLSCVPDTMKEEQKKEVKASLAHFQQLIDAGMVAKKDQDEIADILDHYIEAGTITKQDLHLFLAKVGYFSIRLTPENQDIEGKMKPPDHPLLETSDEVDSTSYR